jgi:hypothetical protein
MLKSYSYSGYSNLFTIKESHTLPNLFFKISIVPPGKTISTTDFETGFNFLVFE